MPRYQALAGRQQDRNRIATTAASIFISNLHKGKRRVDHNDGLCIEIVGLEGSQRWPYIASVKLSLINI